MPKRRWEYNIRMELKEIGINAGDWVDSAENNQNKHKIYYAIKIMYIYIYIYIYIYYLGVDGRTILEWTLKR